ncbi:hypothetical protein [Algoriphagus antarcticus]|uniref:Viral A-type inclusion protein n=1 Tax=Algoriphagus antarcticus TaxID=238540 RepID=A0A3E0DNP6_9BACT|nr:hypothetical protein [Algoriphagus antarcticus]REG84466.1 hypothetical protein C8N25_11541 [Algoriphagus antarcticus]
MKRTILFLILTSFLFVNACGLKGSSENEKLRAEVIAVHDEVMPKMGQLKSLERKALERAQELESEDTIDSAKVEEYKSLAYDLNHANEAMFEWMHQYEKEDGDKSEEELKQYLDGQMLQITKVNVEMKAALDNAKKALK